MAAYVIIHCTVKDQEKLEQYGAGAGPTLGTFGGGSPASTWTPSPLRRPHDSAGGRTQVLIGLRTNPKRRAGLQDVLMRGAGRQLPRFSQRACAGNLFCSRIFLQVC